VLGLSGEHVGSNSGFSIAEKDSDIGVAVRRIFVQKMKTKWESCNPGARNIRFSTDLAKKPRECLGYFVIHEMVHMLEPTHQRPVHRPHGSAHTAMAGLPGALESVARLPREVDVLPGSSFQEVYRGGHERTGSWLAQAAVSDFVLSAV
jgi:hypothetical protein